MINRIEITVAGKRIPDEEIPRYQILFFLPGNIPTPTLYYKGRRVIDEYKIEVIHERPKDPHGRSA